MATVTGRVVDSTGLPLPGAVVTVRGTAELAVTDEQGKFSIEAPSGAPTLVVEMPGFAIREVPVGDPSTPVTITLTIAAVTSQVVVYAPSTPTVPDPRMVLRPLDVVRTAGAQADVMRAINNLPGVVSVDEGAGLYVRGGDVSETRVLFNGGVVNHPYRYETPTGGFRGAVDPFLTSGLTFSTGGFSAEYGNSLSGVLDMQGLGRPTAAHANASVGLAGVAGSASVPVSNHAGFRFAANRATPAVLFSVNPSPREFDHLPDGWDVSGSGHVETSLAGTIRVFGLAQRDSVGVKLEQDAFAGFLHSSADHALLVIDWRRPLGHGWSASAAGSTDRYTSGTNVGVFDIAVTDRERSFRADITRPAGGSWRLRFGTDVGVTSARILGTAPEKGGDFAGVSGTTLFIVDHQDVRTGAYVEGTRSFGRVTPTIGLRTDRFSQSETWRADPRVALAIDLGRNVRLRAAWGVYHQAPSARYFDMAHGINALDPMSATHYVVGIEQGLATDPWFFRAEAYYKTYRSLPVDDGAGGFTDDGYGSARGVDLFARRVWHYMDVRASASFLDAARRWTSPDQRDRYPLPSGTWTPDFAIPFTWQLNATIPVWKTVSVGASWRVAAGRPFTPVAGAAPTADGYVPIWGPINSERMPTYARFDLAVSHTRTFGAHGLTVFYASIDNVTGRFNYFEYAYSADYTERRPVASAAPRSFYVGCSITR